MSAIEQADARELTPEEQEARAQKCFEIESRIKSNIATGRAALWELAKNLYEFDEEHGWTALGYENQGSWLADPEIGMDRTAYYRLVRKWRELVVFRELPVESLAQLEPSKVDIVLPAIEGNKLKLDEVLEDVKTLGAKDLREMYVRGPKAPPKTKEDSGATPPQGDPSEAPEGSERLRAPV